MSMDMKLSDRVAALTGPDRRIDADIHEAVTSFPARDGGVGWPCGTQVVPAFPGWMELPAYTASLDAAMTLAFPSWWFEGNAPLSQEAYGYSREDQRKPHAGFQMIEPPYIVGSRAATLPLATAAAALKARGL
ncbi:MAG TPA: hypothetical protein VF503_30565 [Sphingobium sp.]|uniref:hypothetical protein n=1 Tax=Sphingobium sp. TaxID=1912891 RepID=UPI002ED0CB9F